jgi:hypothetical protein
MTMILRGRKLQEALQLVAEGQLSDFQIAERLNVSPRILKATRELPFFEKRVAEIRQVLQQNPGGATRENPVYDVNGGGPTISPPRPGTLQCTGENTQGRLTGSREIDQAHVV